ncbi:hypothetical protein RCOM_1031520 [Ricinus communis]|uniref:Uncharacterized protein n=1 Tax=Ricinus communis TaxID=3988 RepID=B9RJ61_RICCO|nr:hypothetical protein RCOM_1031520 [Ricinus communis]
MTSAIGWYGPLIDLSKAASHIGDFVQLLVFVHRCSPIQYKLSKGGEVIRTDIQVGDDTLPYFSVSLWQKQMATLAVTGDVILLQNVKITKFGDIIEAKTVQFSSLHCLIHPYDLLFSKGVDDLVSECQVGNTTLEKLVKVVKWVQRAASSLYNIASNAFQKRQLPRNWKVVEQSEARDIFLLSQVLHLRDSCKAIFHAFVGEIFLPITWRLLGDSEKENMFENYGHLNKALVGTDHSWTALTLKLCTSLGTATELIRSTNSNVASLSERVQELEKIVKRGDSAVAAAKAVHVSLNQKDDLLSGSQNVQ